MSILVPTTEEICRQTREGPKEGHEVTEGLENLPYEERLKVLVLGEEKALGRTHHRKEDGCFLFTRTHMERTRDDG